MRRKLLGLLCFIPIVGLLVIAWPVVLMVGGAMIGIILIGLVGLGLEYLWRTGIKLLFEKESE